MAYRDRTLTVRSLAPQGKRPPFLFLAVLIFLPVVAWGVTPIPVSGFEGLKDAIESYDGTTDVVIEVTGNFSMDLYLEISASSTNGTLTIKSDGPTPRTLTRGTTSTSDMMSFMIQSGIVVFQNIVIDGSKNSSSSDDIMPLVALAGPTANFEMKEGAVLRNNVPSSEYPGVVYVAGGGTFTMSGGEISGNTASGVYVEDGTFTMSGGEIKDNTQGSGSGCGVFVDADGTFTMTGGEISGNTADYGGGVFVNNSTFTMSGGEIKDNTAYSGGGVFVQEEGAFFTMSGGEISGNTVSYSAGGVYFENGTFTVGGTAKILNNTKNGEANNFYLYDEIYITLGTNANAPRSGMQVYVQTATDSRVIVNSGATANDAQYFYADENGKAVVFEAGKLIIPIITTFGQLRAAIEAEESPIIIGKSFAITEPLTIANSNITIESEDGEPYTLTRGTASDLFRLNSGTLTLENIIIDGNIENYPNNNTSIVVVVGSLVMESGTVLKNNRGGGQGGSGVLINAGGTFTMNGGEISGNTVTSYGGGVCVNSNNGTFTMNGGKISGNTAGSYGGGVYLSFSGNSSNASFTMNGGEISGNTVPAGEGSYGGGVGFSYGTLTLGGTAKIFGNTKDGNASNVYSREGTHINLGTNANAPQAGMRVYIQTTDAEGVIVESGATAGAEQYFYAEEDGKAVVFRDNQLVFEDIQNISPIISFPQLKAAISAGRESIVIGKNFYITESLGNPGSNITIKSDGTIRTLTRYVTGYLFSINSGKLVFENIIIDGNKEFLNDNTNALVFILRLGENAEFEMREGTVLQNNAGSGVQNAGGSFIMSGGIISGNTATGCGGVSGSFIMSGGTISGNTATGDGGGVCGCPSMSGGTISGNKATGIGGGVRVSDGCTFTMTGGEISGNSAADGGGVFVSSSINPGPNIINKGTFTMTGGKINGNTATNGGGVYVEKEGSFIVGGTAKISNNTKSGAANNVYLNDEKYITLDTDAPQSGMEVYMQTETASGIIVESGATEDDAQYFHADLDGKAVVYENNQLIIKNAISTASISLTAPETGETPNTEATTGHSNFTLGPVTWEGDPLVFTGSTQYTATVTLTAKDGYTFTKDLTATIDGPQANVIENTGNTATISHTFHETTPLAITEFKVTKQPDKLQYTYGDQFDWSGLEVKLTYNDGTTEDVPYEEFADRNITVREDDATAMTIGEIIVTIECGSHTNFVYLTVGKAKLTITAEDKEIIYGDAVPTYTATYSGLVNNETESVLTGGTITSEYKQGNNAGKYDITPSGYSSDNYEITYVNGTLTVGKRDLSNAQIAEIEPIIYTGEAHKPTPSVSDGNLIKTSDYTVSYANNTNVGTATLTLTATASGNYTGTKTANFQIIEKPFVPLKLLTITANDTTITYGDAEPVYKVTITGINSSEADLVDGTITSNYTQGDSVGRYTITPSGYSSANYDITYIDGTLTVGRRDLNNVQIAEIEPIIYTGEAHKPTPSVSDGNLIKTSDYTVSYANNTEIGTATLTLTATRIGNYIGTKIVEFQIIEKPFVPLKLLTITANDTTITYGDTVPTYTVTITESENDLIGGTITSDYKQGDNVGEYTITPSGYFSANYDIEYVNGTLTVAPAELAFVPVAEKTEEEGVTLAEVPLPEGYAWADSTILLKAEEGDRQYFPATYTRKNYKEAQGTIVINVAKKDSKHVIMMTAVIAPSDTATETETIVFEKQKDLSTQHKTVFFTNSCKLDTANIQIAVTDPSLRLKVDDIDTSNNSNYDIRRKFRSGFDTIFYDFRKGDSSWRDTAVIKSPIPFDKIIKQKWRLMIINHDTATNGGYKIDKDKGYKWFGGKKDEMRPYYDLSDSDERNNLFSVELETEDSNNIKLNTCEGSPTEQRPPLESQGAYKKQVLGINGKTANGKIYNIKGKLSTKNAPPGVYIVEEKQ